VLSSLACQSSTLFAQVWRRASVSGTPWLFTNKSPLSSAYNVQASDSCLRLLLQVNDSAFALVLVSVGSNRAARIAIIAITTSNSMRVNAEEGLFILIFIFGFSFLRVVLRVFGSGD
jgi:hypothetical protein